MNTLMSPRKIVVYSHDTFGLGNIRRMLAISKAMVDADAQTSLLIISGSPMLHAFRIEPRLDYVKLPCLSRDVHGHYGARSLPLDYEQLLRIRANIIQSTLRHFEPDIFLVDKKPLGVGQELELAFADMRKRGAGVKSVLLLRDILDTPEVTRQVWHKHDYQGAIANYYDKLLVVGTRTIFDVPLEYGFSPAVAAKTEFCGYIGRETGRRSRDVMRQSFGISDEPMVLVTAGGGEDGYRLLSAYLSGLETLDSRPTFRSVILCGPEMPAAHRTLIHERAARRSDVLVEEFTDDIMSYMAAADLVVSMGGYNTVCEILTLRKRAIIVPRVQPVQEQLIRAERMSALRLISHVHPDELSPARLMAEVKRELSCSNVHSRTLHNIDMQGLPRIVEQLHTMIEQPQHLPCAVRGW